MKESSAIQAMSYVRDTAKLRLTFKDGSQYEYKVPPAIWREMSATGSIGEYFQKHIRHRKGKRL